MPPIWSDCAPLREWILPPPASDVQPIKEHYGFDEFKDQASFHVIERDMALACTTLLELLRDVKRYDKALTTRDAHELINLICCLHRDLISAFKDAYKTILSSTFDEHYETLSFAIKTIPASFKRFTDHPSAPTSRTLIELIARIIAQQSGTPLNLEMYQEKLSNLHVSKWLQEGREKRTIENYIGIPRVVFVCIHTTDNNEDGAAPQHIIGTSKEQWPHFPKLKCMDRELRNKRLKDLSVLTTRTEKVWDTVRKNHENDDEKDGWIKVKNGKKKEGAKRTKESIVQARKAAVTELQQAYSDSEKLSHCDRDQAAAFYCPKWTLGGRCFKCQSLHPFTMHPEAASHELKDKNLCLPLNTKGERYEFGGYPEGSCAEDLVFPWCQAVNMLHRHEPTETTTTSGAQGDGQQQQQQQQQQQKKKKKKKKKKIMGIIRF